MQNIIKKYHVQNPILKDYVKFFWELSIENAEINHKIIPQSNINIRFNIGNTPLYAIVQGKEQLVESVSFSGLQDKFTNIYLKLNGKLHVIGVCFYPDVFFAFFNIPVNEFKNQLLGASETGLWSLNEIYEQQQETSPITIKFKIIEDALVKMLFGVNKVPDRFRKIFAFFNNTNSSITISEFCKQTQINSRSLERMFNKYVGISASTYATLKRFHISTNQLLKNDFDKLSDIAFDNGYYDQMHFIRDFKRFAGKTPNSFIRSRDSILQIGKFS